jgi:hypothetical protein
MSLGARRVFRPLPVRTGSASAVALLLLVVTISLFPLPTAWASSKTTSTTNSTSTASTSGFTLPSNTSQDIFLVQEPFFASVPSYAVLGENYTLSLVVQNKANITVPIVLQVVASVDAIYTYPRVVRTSILPDTSLTVRNFTMVPFGAPHQGGPFNITAELYVFYPNKMSSPQLIGSTTAVVTTIGPNPFPYLDLLVASAAIVAVVLVLVFYPEVVRGRKGSGIRQ